VLDVRTPQQIDRKTAEPRPARRANANGEQSANAGAGFPGVPATDALAGVLARAVLARGDAASRRPMQGHRTLQRLVSHEQVGAEARRLWKRKGSPDQTEDEQRADWELAIRNTNETEAEARRLWQEKGGHDQSDVEQQRDWQAAHRTVRQRRLAEDIWVAKGQPQNQSAVDAAADWALAAQQLEIEELWDHCDPTIRLPGEADHEVAGRVTAATNALKAKPGFQATMVDALLTHDHGRTPRPFVSVVGEDALGLGGHIVAKHVRAIGLSDDDERRKQAMRVVTHLPLYGGFCPGKAGSFADVASADAAIGGALKILWRQNGGWGAPDGWRNKLARGQNALVAGFWGFQGNIAVPGPIAGFVQEKNPHVNSQPIPMAQRPAYLPNPTAMGDRPLFPGDPQPFPANKNGVNIVPQPGNPLTLNVAPTQITIRVNASPNLAAMGWYVNSAWPV
jgi:hypothetical protein